MEDFSGPCVVCGCEQFGFNEVLWEELVDAWGINSSEEAYINRQQGVHCIACGNNLRALALADALLKHFQYKGTLKKFVESKAFSVLKLLEINEAGRLNATLNKMPQHQLASYPDYNMMDMSFNDNCFDVIVHSDTLEHVSDPILAMSECYRLLKPEGICVFTVPIITGRQSRSRHGMPPSYHGSGGEVSQDMMVHYEFGSDIWEFVVQAGFRSLNMHVLEYPAAIALVAKK
jgi:SAM-dependent methyltransferase